VEIDEAEAVVAEVILTATPSEPAPKAKLNQKIKKIGKLDIAFSMNRKPRLHRIIAIQVTSSRIAVWYVISQRLYCKCVSNFPLRSWTLQMPLIFGISHWTLLHQMI